MAVAGLAARFSTLVVKLRVNLLLNLLPTVLRSLAKAHAGEPMAMTASATHSANFFMFLLGQTDRRDASISTTAGLWPAVAILGGQN
jgi:hypothetical protein